MTSSTASHGSDVSSVHIASYMPTPPPGQAQSPVQPPMQPPVQPPMHTPVQPPVQTPLQPAALPQHEPVRVASPARTNYTPSIQNMKLAQGYARDAFSALDFPDVDGAIVFLEKALAELKGR